MMNPSGSLVGGGWIDTEKEKQVCHIPEAVESNENCVDQGTTTIKTEPVDEAEIKEKEAEINHFNAITDSLGVTVKNEMDKNIVDSEANMNGQGITTDNLNTPVEAIETLISSLENVHNINYVREMKKEVIDECEQATCEHLIETTIEQNFEEIDNMICGNLNCQNDSGKKISCNSSGIVEQASYEGTDMQNINKVNLSEVLNAVDHYESKNTGSAKPLESGVDESIVDELIYSDLESNISAGDSEIESEKNSGNDLNKNELGKAQNEQTGTDSYQAFSEKIDNGKNKLGSNVSDEKLLEKFNICECYVYLEDINDSNSKVSGSSIHVKSASDHHTDLDSTIRTVSPSQTVNGVQCRVCEMKMKDVKSLIAHSRIHRKHSLMCCLCGPLYTYYNLSGLEKHMAKHGNSHLECSLCGQICPNEWKLKLHSKKHGIRPFPCSLCLKSYNSMQDLEDHMRTHTNTRPYKCHVCKLCFTSFRNLSQHTSYSHGDQSRQFSCSLCFKNFKRKEHLKVHMKHVHTDARPYVCSTCGRSYKGSGSLCLHQRSHTGEHVTCERCGRNFRDPGDLKKHIRAVHDKIKTYKCDMCGHLFSNQHNLNVHMNGRHVNGLEERRKYNCEQCNWSALTPSQLKLHMKSHIKSLDYQCQICSKKFKCEDYLQKHVRLIHNRTGEKIQCSECSKTFTAKSGLLKHMQFHKYGYRYKCGQCNARFLYSNHLKRHIKYKHEGFKQERKKCKICGKHVAGLKTHIESHSNEKPFKCHKCPQKFRTQKHLTLHLRVHWKTKPYCCNLCEDSTFTRVGNYVSHMKRFHDIRMSAKEADEHRLVDIVKS